MRIGRVVAPLYTLPGRALLALDAVRDRGAEAPEPADTDGPAQLLVTVVHWRASSDMTDRLQHMLECLRNVLELGAERTTVAITTNQPEAVLADLAEHRAELPAGTAVKALPNAAALVESAGDARAVLVNGWKPSGIAHRHPYYLTWGHKRLICAGLGDPGYSHFLYLEDDLCFTAASLRYWRQYRRPLARYGLIPGFVRVESLDGTVYVVDQSEPASCGELPAVSLPEGDDSEDSVLRFVNLPNAYQGMYILDRQLAIDHCRRSPAREPWRSRALVDWEIRERAAAGPILDDVPTGFRSRNVVPVRVAADGACDLDGRCTLVHLPGNYIRGAHPSFGIIRLSEMFAGGSLPGTRA